MNKLTMLLSCAFMICSLTACAPETTNKPDTQNTPPVVNTTPEVTPEIADCIEIQLFFPDNEANYLMKESRLVTAVSEAEMPTLILNELKKGPTTENLFPAVYGDFNVLSATVEDGLCTIDLSKEFAKENTGGTTKETFALQSIVHSLCQIDGIEQVKFNIEGNANAEFGGHYTIDEPFSPDTNMLKPVE